MEQQTHSLLNAQYTDGQLIYAPATDLLDMDGGNTRRKRAEKDRGDLKASIEKSGITQSLLARPHPSAAGKFELIAGYGRRDIAQELNIEAPIIVRLVDDRTALEMHIEENTVRSDLSLIDEVYAAQRWVSFYSGDRKSASVRLGWPLSKMNERLELLKCTESVLTELEKGTLQAGHAIILSAFEEKIQNNTLAKILSEKWTVKYLKERASVIQISLSTAKFDTTECNGCAFNTEKQGGLFGMDSDEAKCSQPKCFQSKTKSHLESQKDAIEERYGKAIWLSESLQSDRNTVSSSVVGEAQFTAGCKDCSKRLAVIDDSIRNAGAVMESQCIDTTCFNKCVAATQTPAKPKKDANNQVSTGSVKGTYTATSKGKDDTKKTKNTVAPGQVSNVVLEMHQDEVRIHAGDYLKGNAVYALAIQVLGLADYCGFPIKGRHEDSLNSLMQKSVEQLQQLLAKVTEYSLTQSTLFQGNQAFKMLSSAARTVEGFENQIVNKWQPSEAILQKYRTEGLDLICTQSKFNESYEKANGKGSYKKLMGGRKKEVIAAMLKTEHDWTDFAPDTFRKILTGGAKQ